VQFYLSINLLSVNCQHLDSANSDQFSAYGGGNNQTKILFSFSVKGRHVRWTWGVEETLQTAIALDAFL